MNAEKAERLNDLKSAILDATSHEIRNSLNSIKIAVTTLLSGNAGDETCRREMLSIIDEEADRMDRLLDAAAQMARVAATMLSVKKEPQDMARLIPAAIQETGTQSDRGRIRVKVPDSLPPVQCDKGMILPALKQLLSNALKYSPAQSPLTVSAEFTGTAVVIAVLDSGPGIPADERDRIFEKHYRGSTAVGTHGTGLGLSSARRLARAHGGEVWMSTPLAGGAAFHLSLPASMAECEQVGE